MDPRLLFGDVFARVFERKWVPIALVSLFFCSAVCGVVFVRTPAFYEYQLRILDRFLDRVCYSERSVVAIFFERAAGDALVLLLVTVGGFHPAALAIDAVTVAFRAFHLGGTAAMLFSVYGVPGAYVAFVLYLPVRIPTDAVLLTGAALAVSRAFGLGLCREAPARACADFLVLSLILLLICIFEAILLAAFFHPAGNLI